MKLFYTTTSPFARKVRIAIREKNLSARVEEVIKNPFDNPEDLIEANPLGKIPVLILDDGKTIFESMLIAKYIDSLSSENSLFPEDNTKWDTLKQHALAHEIMTIAGNRTLEKRRVAEEQSPSFLERSKTQIERSIQALQSELNKLAGAFNIAHISFYSALAYVDFRHPEIDWKTPNRELTNWFSHLHARESIRDTVFANP